MAILDSLGDKITQVGQGISGKSREMEETSRLQNLMSEEERTRERTLALIGRKYIEQYGEEGEFSELIREVKKSEERLQAYRERLDLARGVVRCTCGAEVPANSVFCNVCGQRIIRNVSYGDAGRAQEDPDGTVDSDRPFESDREPASRPVQNTAPADPDKVPCPECGTLCKPTAKFCVGCGKPLEMRPAAPETPPEPVVNTLKGDRKLLGGKGEPPREIVCPQCGKTMAAGKNFCTGCGTKLKADETDQTQTAAPSLPEAAPSETIEGGSGSYGNVVGSAREPAPAEGTAESENPERSFSEDMICPDCGNVMPMGMKFCTQCGRKLDRMGDQ